MAGPVRVTLFDQLAEAFRRRCAIRRSSISAERVNASARLRWLRPVLLVGAVYGVAGLGFGALAGWAPSPQMREAWRLAAAAGLAWARRRS